MFMQYRKNAWNFLGFRCFFLLLCIFFPSCLCVLCGIQYVRFIFSSLKHLEWWSVFVGLFSWIFFSCLNEIENHPRNERNEGPIFCLHYWINRVISLLPIFLTSFLLRQAFLLVLVQLQWYFTCKQDSKMFIFMHF